MRISESGPGYASFLRRGHFPEVVRWRLPQYRRIQRYEINVKLGSGNNPLAMVPLWLAATGVAVNVGAFITAGRSLTSELLTPVGRLCHIAFLMATTFVTCGLAGSASTYYSSTELQSFS
jgi:hypothetical protein